MRSDLNRYIIYRFKVDVFDFFYVFGDDFNDAALYLFDRRCVPQHFKAAAAAGPVIVDAESKLIIVIDGDAVAGQRDDPVTDRVGDFDGVFDAIQHVVVVMRATASRYSFRILPVIRLMTMVFGKG